MFLFRNNNKIISKISFLHPFYLGWLGSGDSAGGSKNC